MKATLTPFSVHVDVSNAETIKILKSVDSSGVELLSLGVDRGLKAMYE